VLSINVLNCYRISLVSATFTSLPYELLNGSIFLEVRDLIERNANYLFLMESKKESSNFTFFFSLKRAWLLLARIVLSLHRIFAGISSTSISHPCDKTA